MQAEKARYVEELKCVQDAHTRELGGLRAELNQHRARERERRDDSSRVHDELLAVRAELVQSRSDNERTYHEQLLPTQVLTVLAMHACLALYYSTHRMHACTM